MKPTIKSDKAFTLVELLVVIVVMGILAALLLPVLSAAKDKAKQTTCLNNLNQINLGIRMYCDDSNDISPAARFPAIAYKKLIKEYVGLSGHSSPQDRIFACPADTFFYYDSPTHGGLCLTNSPQHEYAKWDYSSYWFNGQNIRYHSVPRLGIAGLKITSIKDPEKTALIAEAPAFLPFSWHQPRFGEGPMFNDAKDMVSFVDGHASFIRIYYQEVPGNSLACEYNAPAGYDYKWNGD
jgi:prepilin-type N-terminal cleavage/methylation domain-containing protein